MACPTSLGSGSRSSRWPLPRTVSSPCRQSMSSNAKAARLGQRLVDQTSHVREPQQGPHRGHDPFGRARLLPGLRHHERGHLVRPQPGQIQPTIRPHPGRQKRSGQPYVQRRGRGSQAAFDQQIVPVLPQRYFDRTSRRW